MRFSHLHGTNIWGTNTRRSGVKIPEMKGIGHVDLVIDDLPLLNGTYDLTVAISDQAEVHPYDHWDKRIRFDVHQDDLHDEGLVTITSHWVTQKEK